MIAQDFTNTIGNLRNKLVTLRLFHQTDVEGEQVGSVFTHQAEGVVLVGHTYGVVDGLDLIRVLRAHLLHQLVAQRLGGFHARALRQLHRDTQTGVILCGEELRRDNLQQAKTDQENSRCDAHDRFPVIDAPAEQTGITLVQTDKEFLNRTINFGKPFALFRILLQKKRTEHRGQRHSGRQRDGNHNGDNPTQLFEEHTGHTGQEGQRQKHGDNHQGGSDNGERHLAGGEHGRRLGF